MRRAASGVSILFLLRVTIVVMIGSVIWGLNHHREAALEHIDMLERHHTSLLEGVLQCGNGNGLTLQISPDTMIRVSCNIEYEWMQGKFYLSDLGRRPRRK
jgi:hypothetical protein